MTRGKLYTLATCLGSSAIAVPVLLLISTGSDSPYSNALPTVSRSTNVDAETWSLSGTDTKIQSVAGTLVEAALRLTGTDGYGRSTEVVSYSVYVFSTG